MKFQDERTDEQKRTHYVIIAATDKFMSGWGGAEGGTSYVGWACRPEHESEVYRWVKGRSEMKRVRRVAGSWRPRGEPQDHCHIYVVDDQHPALRR